jgi:hypothetical protein
MAGAHDGTAHGTSIGQAAPGEQVRPQNRYLQAKTGCSKCATLIMFACSATWQNW